MQPARQILALQILPALPIDQCVVIKAEKHTHIDVEADGTTRMNPEYEQARDAMQQGIAAAVSENTTVTTVSEQTDRAAQVAEDAEDANEDTGG